MRFTVFFGLAVSVSGCVTSEPDGSVGGERYLLSSSAKIAEPEGLASLCDQAGLSVATISRDEVLCSEAGSSGVIRFARLVTEAEGGTAVLRVHEWEEGATASLAGAGGDSVSSGHARLGLLIEAAGGRRAPPPALAANEFRFPTILF